MGTQLPWVTGPYSRVLGVQKPPKSTPLGITLIQAESPARCPPREPHQAVPWFQFQW